MIGRKTLKKYGNILFCFTHIKPVKSDIREAVGDDNAG
jgi:hypothetical protein